ncbi:unspecific monooxygenase (plasmid) [Rhodococcus erythropolis R138]|uniref:cytochrome P450 n=1 Tax=Rhodococcus erythropolis TaxID=1833 RepID=UPI000492E0A1|nr:cytochrome P450 [Rhodococcus erythropolis]ALU73455.1 unspecific monooxygenase [Rhodococcus erythropolis R138]
MTAGKAAPVAEWLDPQQLLEDPYPAYSRLRRESPIAWVPFMDSYVASLYEDCRTLEMTTEVFVSSGDSPARRAIGRSSMIDTDDPEHREIRKPVNSGLRPKVIKERWGGAFEKNARFYLDVLADQGPRNADLNSAFAAPLAAKNLIDLLGLGDVDVDDVRNWSSTLMLGVANTDDDEGVWAQVDATRTQIDDHLTEVLRFLRHHPDDTFTSALAAAGLPEDVIKANVKLAIAGGINEPQHAVTSMVWSLSEHPEQRELVLNDPVHWPAVFDETLRWISPLGLVVRVAAEDTVLRGVSIPAGSNVTGLVASANRDASIFSEADDFDITRQKIVSLAFGSGVHMCAGMWAAKWAIGNIAVPMLYRRFEGLRTATDRESPWFGFVVRGLQHHAVTWDQDRGTV